MGGNVFLSSAAEGQPSLATPRMSATTYSTLKQKYTNLLSASFPNALSIGTAIEAPEKADFGDIDIIIVSDEVVDWATVAISLGAAAWVNRGTDSKPACSLAVPLDGSRSSTSPPVKYVLTSTNDPLQRTPSPAISPQRYAQIDLVIVPSALAAWTAFYSSYGDLAGILGMIVTNFGFDVTETGLRLRLQEWDDSRLTEWQHFNPRLDEGKMMLSADPGKVMEFVGLSVRRYEEGFATVDELFRWLGECNVLSRHCLKRERIVPKTKEGKKVSRSMFNTFYTEWLPAHLDEKEKEVTSNFSEHKTDGTSQSSLWELRQLYLSKALTFFHKHLQYDALHHALLRNRDLATAETLLRPIIAAQSRKSKTALAELVRAFRRNVAFENGQPVILGQGQSDENSQLPSFLEPNGRELKNSAAVVAWIQTNFDTVKEVERERQKKKRSVTVAELE